MPEEIRTRLLKVSLDGRVVAEADLVIYDAQATWQAFVSAFQEISREAVGELFNTVHVATDPGLRLRAGPQGIVIDLQSGDPEA